MVAFPARKCAILFIIIVFNLYLIILLYWHSNDHDIVSRAMREHDLLNHDIILIDRREAPSMEQRLAWMREELPSFPLDELQQLNASQHKLECAPAPNFANIEFHNDYWQVARLGGLNYYIFGAYYDKRPSVSRAPLVRLLAMVNEGRWNEAFFGTTFCQLWFESEEEPAIVPVHEHKIIWNWGKPPSFYYPILISCALPEGELKQQVPIMVSLVQERCARASNLLRVVYEPPDELANKTAPRFAICVKSMDFPYSDMSWRLIEWLEMMRLLGAEKITFYKAQMHANMTLVLQHYMETNPDFIELRPLSLGRGEPHAPPHFSHYALQENYFNRILNEMIPYNDCFYRNLYKFDYVGVFDIDEIIMPLGNITNWAQLVKVANVVRDYKNVTSAKCTSWVSYCFRNVYYPRYPERPRYFPHLPSYFYMLQHVERVAEHCDRTAAAKCLHSTQYAVGLHNHFAIHWTDKVCCPAKVVPIEFAQMQHYREPDNKTRLLNPVVDDNIWRYQPQLQQRIMEKYKLLGFIPDPKQLEAEREQQRLEDELALQQAAAADYTS